MTDARALRIERRVQGCIALLLIEQLVVEGFDSPRKIKAASNAELKAVRGIGDASVALLREALGQA